MKFIIKKPKDSIYNAMRQIGYRFQNEDKIKQEMSFIKPVGVRDFPRFHIYLKINDKEDNIMFNLHLDQKSPVYKAAPAHSADYEGDVVEREAERIKLVIDQ